MYSSQQSTRNRADQKNLVIGAARFRRSFICWTAIAVASIAGIQITRGDQVPSGCLPQSNVGIAIYRITGNVTNSVVGQTLVVGETIWYQARVGQDSPVNCAVEGGRLEITTPDNVTTNATLGLTIPLICGSPGCPPGGVSEFVSKLIPYTVQVQDIGTSRANITPCNPTPDGQVQAKATYTGGVSHCDPFESCDPTSTISLCNAAVAPCLEVIKQIACEPANGVCSNGVYSGFARGVKAGSQLPAFCYSITLTNCGTAPLVITNVDDTVFGDITEVFPSSSLSAGEAQTIFFSTDLDSDTTNIVTALGFEAIANRAVAGTASATAQVVAASISCSKCASSPDDKDGNPTDCHVMLIDNGVGHSVDYSITVTNTGNAALDHVIVTDPLLPISCAPAAFSLAVGGSTNFICPVTINCADLESDSLTNTVTVSALVSTNSGVCGLTSNGVPISVNHQCQAVVVCVGCPTCAITPTSTNVCAGSSATFIGQVTGGIGPFFYNWSGPNGFVAHAASISINNAQAANAGSYSLTVTNGLGCITQCSASLTVNPNPTVTVNSPTVCSNALPATITATPSGNGPFHYAWTVPGGASNPGDVASFNATVAGTYSVVVTDVHGCTGSNSGTLTVNPNPTVSVNSPTSCSNALPATITATPSGNGPFHYAWIVPGGASNPGDVASFNATVAGTYSVVVTDVHGCTGSNSGTLTVNPNPTVSVNSPTVCSNALPATITATPSGNGPFHYAWTVPGGASNPGDVVSFSATVAGIYSVVITDVNGCTGSGSGTLKVNQNPTVSVNSPTVCSNALPAKITATASGNGPFHYIWTVPAGASDPGDVASFNATKAGNYSVVVTDANGCTGAGAGTLIVNPVPTASAGPDQAKCQAVEGATSFDLNGSGSNGSPSWSIVNTNGTANASIVNGTTFTPSVNVTGNGTVTVRLTVTSNTEPSCGMAMEDLILTVNARPVCIITGNDTICVGGSTVFCAPAGLVSYSWAGPQFESTSRCITVSVAGVYSVMITDSNGCVSSCSRELHVNQLPLCSIEGDGLICDGSTTTFCATPGMAHYAWTGPNNFSATSQCVTVGVAGVYNVTITDQNGCQSSCAKQLSLNPLPMCLVSGNCMLCPGEKTQLCASDGMASYSWIGPNGFTSQEQCIIVSNPGPYRVTIVDQNGCSNSCQHTVVVNEPPVAKITGVCEVCEGGSTELCGPDDMVAYSWTGPQGFLSTNQCVTVNAAGVYGMFIMDSNGCTNIAKRTLIVQPPLTCRIEGACKVCGGVPTTLCATPGMVSYLWHGPNDFTATTQCITITNGGTYSVDVVDNLGCSNSCTRSECGSSDVPGPSSSIEGTGNVCEVSTNTYTAITTADPRFKWIILGHGTIIGPDNQSTVTVEAGAHGSFQLLVAVENDDGCGSTAVKTVIVDECEGQEPLCPHCDISGNLEVCLNATNTYAANCQTQVGSYLWQVSGDGVIDGSATGPTVKIIASGDGAYIVRLRTITGICTNDALVVVTVNNCSPGISCSISGPTPVCPDSSNEYDITTDAGASVTWLISGNGMIDGSTHASSVDVVALDCSGEGCSFELTAMITKDGVTNFCSKIVQVNAAAGAVEKPSRTSDFWKSHAKDNNANAVTLLKAIQTNGGHLSLGFVTLPTRDVDKDGQLTAEDAMREAMGLLAKKASTKKLKGARIGLAHQLIAAIANKKSFSQEGKESDCLAAVETAEIEQASVVGACNDIAAILEMQSRLQQMNNRGITVPVPAPQIEGTADLKGSLKGKASISSKLFKNTENCGK